MMFIIGTGSAPGLPFDKYFHSGSPRDAATAWAAAIDTPSSAFAPSLPLFGVPSSAINFASRPLWSAASKPFSASAIAPLTFATAFFTPLPP